MENGVADPDEHREQERPAAPYEGVISEVVSRISHEPMLFVIGIGALLVGLGVLAVGLGSPDVQFLAAIIGVLAFVAIVGYYVVQVRSSKASRPRASSSVTGSVRVQDQTGGDLAGVRSVSDPPVNADVKGTVDVTRASGGRATGVDLGSPHEPTTRVASDDDP